MSRQDVVPDWEVEFAAISGFRNPAVIELKYQREFVDYDAERDMRGFMFNLFDQSWRWSAEWILAIRSVSNQSWRWSA